MINGQMPERSQQVVRQALSGSSFTLVAQSITTLFGLGRSILLARLLAPAEFGIVALALFYVSLLSTISTFGLNSALIQRNEEEPTIISTHFVMRMGLALLGFLLTILIVPLLGLAHADRPELTSIIIPLGAIELLSAAASTPLALLNRRLAFKRIAVINVISSVSMTILAPLLAYAGMGIWSLILGERAIGALVSFVAVWFWRPPWKPNLRADWQLARDYLRFGKHVFASGQLTYLLDRFDDFWTGAFLGNAALGFYGKAYEYARYPRRLIASPLSGVLFAGYARLQDDRDTLAKFFFRSASLIFRANCLFSVALFMIVPEFVELVLGEQWLPMVPAFRLLIVYSLLDPLFVTSSSLTTALGKPEVLTRTKLWQLLVFVPAVILLGLLWEIAGVALAADLMLLVGIGSVLRAVRRLVPFSLGRLLLPPLAAAIVAALAAQGTVALLPAGNPLWLQMIFKGGLVLILFGLIMLLLERREVVHNVRLLRNYLMTGRPALRS